VLLQKVVAHGRDRSLIFSGLAVQAAYFIMIFNVSSGIQLHCLEKLAHTTAASSYERHRSVSAKK